MCRNKIEYAYGTGIKKKSLRDSKKRGNLMGLIEYISQLFKTINQN